MVAPAFYSAVLFIGAAFLGAVLGSFASALAYRVSRGQAWYAIRGKLARSHCPSCGTCLRFKDLIPLASWLVCRGKCRYCASNIGISYIMLEIASIVLCLGIYASYGVTLATFFALASVPFLLALGAPGNTWSDIVPLTLLLYPALFGVLFRADLLISCSNIVLCSTDVHQDSALDYSIAIVSYTAVCLLFAQFSHASELSRKMRFNFAIFGAMSGVWLTLYMLPFFILIVFALRIVLVIICRNKWSKMSRGTFSTWTIVVTSFYCALLMQSKINGILILL